MKRIASLIIFVLGWASILIAQPVVFDLDGDEVGIAAFETDEGYIVFGQSEDLFLLYIDPSMKMRGARIIPNTELMHLNCVVQKDEQRYLLSGRAFSAFSGNNVFLLEVSQYGDIILEKHYKVAADEWTQGIVRSDDGFVLAGGSGRKGSNWFDVLLMKVDSEGKVIWKETIGGSGDEWANSIINARNGYLVIGSNETTGKGKSDVYLVRVADSGKLLWSRVYGGPKWDKGSAGICLNDGGFIIAGWTNSFGKDYDAYMLRIDSSGDIIWQKNFDTGHDNRAFAMAKLDSESFVVVGQTWTQDHRFDAHIACFDVEGTLLWERTYGGLRDESLGFATKLKNNDILAVGYSESHSSRKDVLVVKISAPF